MHLTTHDDGHDDDGHRPDVLRGNVALCVGVIKRQHILCRVTEHTAEEQYEPRQLKPYQQKGQEGKRPVNGVVFRYVNLAVDEEHLQQGEGYAAYRSRQKGIFELYLAVGYEHIGESESHYGKEQRGEVKHKAHHGSEESEARGDGGTHKDAHAALTNHYHRHEEANGGVVGELAVEGAVLLHVPNLVEGLLNIAEQGNECPEQQDDAHAHENALLGFAQIGIHKSNGCAYGFALRREIAVNGILQKVLKTEAAAYGKQQCHCRHYGQNGGIGEGH